MDDTRTDIEIIGVPGVPTFAQDVRINGVLVNVASIKVHGMTDTEVKDPVTVTLELIPSSLHFTAPDADD